MPASAILQPPKKKAKRKVKVVKKRQKTIPVPSLLPSPLPLLSLLPSPSPSLSLSPPSPATPVEPISIDKVNKSKDKNIEEPVEVEDEDIGSLLPPPPPPLLARFISV